MTTQTRKPLTIAVANQKGGVGKTTTAWHLARHLHHMGLSVLMVDLDPQANLTKLSGVAAHRHSGHVLGGAIQPSATLRTACQIGNHDLAIVPASLDLANTAVGLAQRMFNRIEALANAIAATGNDWHIIIIDCAPNADVLTINALYAADYILIPSQPEELSIDGVNQMRSIHSQIYKLKNHATPIWLIATQVDSRTTQHQMGLEALTRHGTLHTVIPARRGQDADEQLHAAYRQLADKIARLKPNHQSPIATAQQ